MFFQINITPDKKSAPENNIRSQTNPNYSLLLAPFQPPTRIKLESKINIPVECSLTIQNSYNRSLTAAITKFPPQERCVSLSATEWSIQPESSIVLNILWEPKEGGTWRDILQLSDSRRIKYDIPLTLTCIDPNKGAKGKRTSKLRNPLGPKISTIQNAKPSNSMLKNTVTNKNIQTLDKSKAQPATKRTRNSELLNKENHSNNMSFNWMIDRAKTKKLKQEKPSSPPPVDFSKYLDSSVFKFTPIKPDNVPFSSSYSVQKTNESSIIQKDITSVTVESKVQLTLRKDTYITVPKFVQQTFEDSKYESNDEFDDSLSPKATEAETETANAPSEFSMLLKDFKFTPLKPSTANIDNMRFSPKCCSTGHKSDASRSFSDESTNHSTNKNATFDIDKNGEPNTSYNLNVSPTSAKNNINLKPTCLAKTFNKIDLEFSTPLPSKNINESKKCNTLFSKSQVDFGSARDCLEADLWVKTRTSISPISKNIFNSTLDSIKEENIFVDNKQTLNNSDFSEKKFKEPKGFCIEISPPKKLSRTKPPLRKISPTKASKILKERTLSETVTLKKKQQINKSIKSNGSIEIPGVKIAKLSFSGLNKNKNKDNNKVLKKQLKEVSVKLHDPNDFLTMLCNPDPFAATMTQDPFLSNTLYYDEKWIFIQEIEFKKWLNALLTPPEHLTADVETTNIDIGKVWQSCRLKEDITLAETKESVSARYHTNTRLNTLRKAACLMYHKEEVITALSQTTVGIEKEILVIRPDKDLHRDIGLQKIILELFISYNPLWLRIGLETIYGETIPLQSNNDIVGLSRFLLARFFSDPFLVKTHSSHLHPNIRLNTFQTHMNKFMLKKFLFLVYFLDYAKRNTLIGHDPCLFHKKALIKDSRSILLTFSREVLSGIGDITKVLRHYTYVVSHKQTYLDEYDYAVANLSTDLRDGVRLCRIMEVITGKRCLTCQCRVPVISRLQKIHNVNLGLIALKEAGYTITGNIDAKSIVDGHREKTLSLLWQIIYKFQAPRFEKAAKTLQRWWRSKLWYVYIKNILRNRRDNGAAVIQRSWKCYKARLTLQKLKQEYTRQIAIKIEAARKLQLLWRLKKNARIQQMHYQKMKISAIKIQRWWKRIQFTKPYVTDFKVKQQLIINVQRRWRANQHMKCIRNKYLELRAKIVKIQLYWKARHLGKQVLIQYKIKRCAIIFVQNKWRAKLAMRADRTAYLLKLKYIKLIQNWWKRCLSLKKDRNYFIALKTSVKVIERVWIAKHMETVERKHFLLQKESINIIKRAWRNYRMTREDMLQWKVKKNASIKIQTWYRKVIAMKNYRIQRSNCIKIQSWWKNVTLARNERSNYLALKNASIIFQKNWKMKVATNDYKRKKRAILRIKYWYKNIIYSRIIRNEYLKLKTAVKIIETRWYATKLKNSTKAQYLDTRNKIISLQRRWRAQIAMKNTKQKYLEVKNSIVKIQSWWKMILQKNLYNKMLNSVVTLQRRWRALENGKQARKMYEKQKVSIIKLQRRWRATQAARLERSNYLHKRNSAMAIQNYWRSYIIKQEFKNKKNAVKIIENWRLHILNGRRIRAYYYVLKISAIKMQRLWKTKLQMRKYQNKRQSAIIIQKYWKSYIIRKDYMKKKQAALTIQNWRKNIIFGRKIRAEYILYKDSVILIQRKWKTILQSRKFNKQRESAITIQRYWRSYLVYKEYQNKRKAVQIIQKWRRQIIHERIMRKEQAIEKARKEELKKKSKAAVIIQAAWRGFEIRRRANKKMSLLRERVKRAAETADPTNTLAFRLQENIEIFKYVSNVGQLSVCLSSLDVITRLSPAACFSVCQLNLIPKLYDILNRANRSLPWLDVCLKDISILLTIAKFKHTTAYVVQVDYIEVLARLMTIVVNKRIDLFLYTATLIWILAKNPEYAMAANNCVRTRYLLTNLYTSIAKKSSACLLDATVYEKQLPCTKPDWGLKRKRPRTFQSVYQAITAIASRLQILNIPHAKDMQRSFNFSM